MRAVRRVIAALIALALAVSPMSAGIAKQAVAKAEMSMSAPDGACPHGHASDGPAASNDPAADVCALKCCAAAILADGQPPARRSHLSVADTGAVAPTPFTLQPDPPPPRS